MVLALLLLLGTPSALAEAVHNRIVSFDPAATGLLECGPGIQKGASTKTSASPLYKGRPKTVCHRRDGAEERGFLVDDKTGERIVTDQAASKSRVYQAYKDYFDSLLLTERERLPSPDQTSLNVSFLFKGGRIECAELEWPQSKAGDLWIPGWASLRFDADGKGFASWIKYRLDDNTRCQKTTIMQRIDVLRCENGTTGLTTVDCKSRAGNMRMVVQAGEKNVEGTFFLGTEPLATKLLGFEAPLTLSQGEHLAKLTFLETAGPENAKLVAENPLWKRFHPCLAFSHQLPFRTEAELAAQVAEYEKPVPRPSPSPKAQSF